MKQKNNPFIFAIIITALALALPAFVFGLLSIAGIDKIQNDRVYDRSETYTLYIGTNDKDTNLPVMSLDDAERVVTEIAFAYADGFTSYRAKGGWISGETRYDELTLVYVFNGITQETAEQIAADVNAALNQSSVLISRSYTDSTYYINRTT
jgi:hypothetical protein